jgi:Abnormal spindle-like microcephaly-assoc'd, ASPM-SPD-2-Hydin
MRYIRRLLATSLAIAVLSSCGGGGDGTPPSTSGTGTGSGTPPSASATQFSVSPASGSVTSGTAVSITVQALDDSNKLVSSFADTLQVSSSDPNAALPGPLALSGGQATFSVTFNTAGNQTLSVSTGSVRGTSPTIIVNPVMAILTGALSSGVIGIPFNQTIQATGGVAPFAWKVSSGALPHNLSLTPTTTNTVTITGTPDIASQGVAFTIQASDSAHHTATQPYTLSILLQTDTLVLSVASLNFGNSIVGSASSALTETLTNTATADIAISSIAIDMSNPPSSNAGEFTQSSTTCGATLAPGAGCAINLTFTPRQTGPRAAVLTITDDTAGSPQSVGLVGVGLISGPNATLSTESLPFLGTELVGTTSPARTLSLSNYGTVALNIGSISASSSFAETNNCIGSLPPLASCNISVTFTPGGSGGMTGTLSISDDAAGAPQKVTLSGTGSTGTPPLNGTCLLYCGFPGGFPGPPSAPDPIHCPVGQPSRNPVTAACFMSSVVIDEASSCAVTIRGRSYRGGCLAE